MSPSGPELRVDAGFRDLIPPPRPDELELLGQSLVRDGCREPLTVWTEQGVLLDGHNRHEICTRNGIAYRTVELSFPNRAAAELWVIENQLGRRNLADIDRIALAARREPILRAQAAANRGRRSDLLQNSAGSPPAGVTREAAATTANVSHDTYTKGKRVLEHGVPELVQAVRDGVASIHAADAISSLPAEEQREALASGDIVGAAKKARAHLSRSSGNNEWNTPVSYLEAARRVLGGIDLDPATNAEAQMRVQATRYHTAEDDGLTHPWHGRLWLNPPYAQPAVEDFVSKLVESYEHGDVTGAVLLVNNATDTTWWHRAAETSAAICFTRGRIRFERPFGASGSPLQGQCFFYFGADVHVFVEHFGEFGIVLQRGEHAGAGGER